MSETALLTGNGRIPIDQLLVAKGVNQIDAVVPAHESLSLTAGAGFHAGVINAQVVLLTEGPRCTVHLGASLRLRKGHVRRESLEGCHGIVVLNAWINDHKRAKGLAVVRRAGGDERV